jgi:hypothetical protein
MAETFSVSQRDVDALANAIRAAQAAQPPTAAASPLATFCQQWPGIKSALEAIQPVVILIPTVGAIISATIGTLLALGNAAYAALCGGN